MADVFISSIQSGFEDVRAGARAGVENFGHRAVMAETTGAAAASPQRALLNQVAAADIFLLLVGPRYGARQASGLKCGPKTRLLPSRQPETPRSHDARRF